MASAVGFIHVYTDLIDPDSLELTSCNGRFSKSIYTFQNFTLKISKPIFIGTLKKRFDAIYLAHVPTLAYTVSVHPPSSIFLCSG